MIEFDRELEILDAELRQRYELGDPLMMEMSTRARLLVPSIEPLDIRRLKSKAGPVFAGPIALRGIVEILPPRRAMAVPEGLDFVYLLAGEPTIYGFQIYSEEQVRAIAIQAGLNEEVSS